MAFLHFSEPGFDLFQYNAKAPDDCRAVTFKSIAAHVVKKVKLLN
jgi:hypothetical protein